MNEEGVRRTQALSVGLVALAVSLLALSLWSRSGRALPEASWPAGAVLLLMAALLLGAGWQIRSYQQGKAQRMPAPHWSRRVLAGAQASALGGAIVTGWYLAQAALHVPDADVPSQREALVVAGLLALASVLLSVAGFVVQAWCRIPPSDDEDGEAEQDPAPA